MNIRLAAVLLLGATAVAGAEEITLTGTDAFHAMQKTTCGTTEEGITRYGVADLETLARERKEALGRGRALWTLRSLPAGDEGLAFVEIQRAGTAKR